MKLDELKKKLYKPEAEFEERLKAPKSFRPAQKRGKTHLKEWEREVKKELLSPKQKKYLQIGLISAVVIFLIVAGYSIWHGLTSFDPDKVDLKIQGPEKVISGEEGSYTVSYKNNTRLPLKKIRLVFRYPENAIPLDSNDLIRVFELDNLAVGQEDKLELPVRIIGLKDEEKVASAELSYQPGDISSRFTNSTEFIAKIVSVPLILVFDLPDKLISGQSFDFYIRVINQADVSFNDLQLKFDYPTGFNFESAQPKANEDDRIWMIDNLMAGEEKEFAITGNIQGQEEDAKSFKAEMGVFEDDKFIIYTKAIDALKISLTPLAISQTVNNSVDYIAQAGDKLKYEIIYKNTSDVGIRNIVITSKLQGIAFDLSSLDLKQGSYDGDNQTITWKASNLPDLEYLNAHKQGKIIFLVEVKDPLPINSYSDKNFTLINTVKIDSSEKPFSFEDIEIGSQNQLTTKISSDLTLQTKGSYYDDQISNSGPNPPKIGQRTTYTIKWQLVNTANNLGDVTVEGFLPPHVEWIGRISPIGTDITYNLQTGKVIWDIGNLSSATGVLLPVEYVAFQIAINPGIAYQGNNVELIGQSTVRAQDKFTGLELSDANKAIDTDSPVE